MRRTQTISLPVTAVTVLEDRAQVTRSGKVKLTAGHHRLRIEGFSPVACDRTLVARTGEQARVIDVRVRRQRRDQLDVASRDASLVALEEERRSLGRDQTALRRHRDRVAMQLADLGAIAKQRLSDLSDDVGLDRAPPDELLETMAELVRRRCSLTAELAALDAEVDRRGQTLDDLDRRLTLRRERPDETITAVAEVDVTTERDDELELHLDYVVANACWRPYHRVTVEGDQLTFETEGCIWQNTGESWRDVAVSMSTERQSLGVEPPGLETDQLFVRRRPTTMRVETREQAIETVDVDGAPRSEGLAGVDDGGEPQVRRVEVPVTVPSDGHPYRVPLSEFTAVAAIERVAYPELAPVVHRVAKLENRGPSAVLAGPVDVVLDGGLSGRTRLGYVGCGESFELGLGPDADLRIHRETEQKRDDQFRLSSWVRTHHEIRIKLSNLGETTPKIRIRERVPVSEVEKLKINVDARRTTDGVGPDADGFVDWDRVMAPRGTATLVLRYTLERHQDVIMS